MSALRSFDIAGSAMSAQSARLNTVASNLANADAVSGNPDDVYKARLPVFKTINEPGNRDSAGVQVLGIVENEAAPAQRYDPGTPIADVDGHVSAPHVHVGAEVVNKTHARTSDQPIDDMMNTPADIGDSQNTNATG